MTDTYDTLIVWNVSGVVDFDHYNIYRYNEVTSEWDLIGSPKAPAWTDKLLPAGDYYYCVSAVDKNGNESDVSDYVEKSLPELGAPSTPTELRAERNDDRTEIVLTWNPSVPTERVKGYIVYRKIGSAAAWTAIDIVSGNKYTDSSFPAPADPKLGQTAKYTVQAYNADIVGGPASAETAALELALIGGLRTILDYLSLNIYWDLPTPERVAISYVTILYKAVGATTWTVAGFIYYPSSQIRIEGPLVEGTVYLIGYTVNSIQAVYVRDLQIAVTIPTYEHDIVAPTAPFGVKCGYDPDSDIAYISWHRDEMDDDLMYYEVQTSTSVSLGHMFHGTSKDSNYVLRNASRNLLTSYTSILVQVRAVDRSGNVSAWATSSIGIGLALETYYILYASWLKTRICRSLVSSYSETNVAVFDLQWADMGRKLREFKRYVVFETDEFDIYGDPMFDFNAEEIRTLSNTNSARINVFKTSGLANYKVAWKIGVEDGRGRVFYGSDSLTFQFPGTWP